MVGGGIIGLSVAYHLTKLGHRDVVLLERDRLGCGTTWHAAGLVTQLRATENMARLAQYTARLFKDLEAETGQATGFLQCGSVTVATTQARLEELKRGASMGRSFGLEVEMIDAAAAQRLAPLLYCDDVIGAAWIASDGRTNPIDTARAFAAGAKQGGAVILEQTSVDRILVECDRVAGVVTGRGTIRCETVALCAGMWTRELGASLRISIPLHAAEHFYVVTEQLAGLAPGAPTVRDLDGCLYAKEDAGKLLVGFFEPDGKPWGVDGIPADFSFESLPDDLDHITPYLENAAHRLPALRDTGLQLVFNGPESFTPDNRFLLGPAPDVGSLYVAAGFNSCGIESSGGAGKVLAEWMSSGQPSANYWEIDVRRAMPFQRNRRYLRDRTSEAVGLLYAPHVPHKSPLSARGVRMSPLHDRLAAAGARFAEAAGWERASWFGSAADPAKGSGTFARDAWFQRSGEEHRATREGVALFDQTSFAHILVQGPGSERLLQYVSTNDVAVPAGRIVYTPWLNARGGMESDVTIGRLSQSEFLIVTAGAQRTRDLSWLRTHASGLQVSASIVDVSSAYATLSIMGPRSRELLSRVSPADFSDAGFAFGSLREIEVGYALGLAFRLTFVGELGWELHLPVEMALGVYDCLMEASRDLQLRHAGYIALNTLRLEAGYRDWGADIGDEDTPFEAGLGFTVAWSKRGDFLGREVVEHTRHTVPRKRLTQVALLDSEPLLFGTEPVWRNGEMVGYLRSAGYGHTLGCSVGMGYLSCAAGVTPEWLASGRFEVEVAGDRYPALAQLRAFFDPARTRVKGTPLPSAALIDPGILKSRQ